MKIAVALHNGQLASHFSEAEVFAVFHVSQFDCGHPVYRVRGQAEPHSHDENSPHHDNHEDVIQTLKECCAVIVGGMGHRAAAALQNSGIEPVISKEFNQPDVLVEKFTAGTLSRGAFHKCCHG